MADEGGSGAYVPAYMAIGRNPYPDQLPPMESYGFANPREI